MKNRSPLRFLPLALLALAIAPARAAWQIVGSNAASNLSASLYPGRMADGEPVATYARPDAWQEIQAGSGIDLLAPFACDKAQKAGIRGTRRWQGMDSATRA